MVREHLYDQIITGTLKPGHIIQIGAVSQELGVSRTPVRDALLALQHAKIVSVVPNQGFLVRGLTVSDIRDIYLMRNLIECATAELAATRGSKTAITNLTAIHERSKLLAGPGHYDVEFDECCHEFHRQIAVAAESERLLSAVEVVFADQIRLQSIGINPPDPGVIVEEHELICRALMEGDAVQARDAMERHNDTLHRIAIAKLTG